MPHEGDGEASAAEVRGFLGGDGLQFYYRAWEVPSPRAVLRIVHGLGEHGARYASLAHALRERGIATYAIDLRGHGVSGGVRGHVSRFEQYLDDVDAFTRHTASDAPTFLLGHSLGGLIALRAIQTERVGDLRGAILSAPALALASPGAAWLSAAATALAWTRPRTSFSNGIDPADISRDPEAVATYRADPLVHDRITARLYHEMLAAMRSAADSAPRVSIPILLLAPGDDRITHGPTALDVAARFSGDVQVRSYPGAYHEPLTDPVGGTVRADIVTWVDEKLA